MASYKSSITLIGMPGAGKSTVGVLAAKSLVKRFVDTDLAIQTREGRSLQQVLDNDGYEALRSLEAQTLLSLDLKDAVVATGGSAVYSVQAMSWLQSFSVLVYLEVDLATVIARIGDFANRGIAKSPQQTIEEVFLERELLYRSWAEVTLDATRPVEAVVGEIAAAWRAIA
jgi:shikimate kinase